MLISASSTVYTISFPCSLYFGKFANVYFQLSASVTVCSATTVLPFFTCNLMLSGRFPLAFSLSFHTLFTSTEIVSFGTVNVFVIVVPSIVFV